MLVETDTLKFAVSQTMDLYTLIILRARNDTSFGWVVLKLASACWWKWIRCWHQHAGGNGYAEIRNKSDHGSFFKAGIGMLVEVDTLLASTCWWKRIRWNPQ